MIGQQNEVRDVVDSLDVQALFANRVCNIPFILIGRNDESTKVPAQENMHRTIPLQTSANPTHQYGHFFNRGI